jgi:hypothetical protein
VLIVPATVVTEVCYMLARPLNGGGPKLAATFLDVLTDAAPLSDAIS